MFTRVWIGSGPKAENNGETTLPLRSAPSMLTYNSGTRPMITKTLSPLPIPRPRSTLVNRRVSRASSP